MKCPKCGYESTEPDPEDNKESLLSKIIYGVICITIAVLLVSAASYLDDRPDEIHYSGGGHIVGSYDSNVVFFQEGEVWYMIIPEITENGTVDNSSPYYTYYWNGTGWVLK